MNIFSSREKTQHPAAPLVREIPKHANMPSQNLIDYMEELDREREAAAKKIPVERTFEDIDEGFLNFHKANPHIYDKLVDLALGARNNGHTSMGMKMLFERLRWHFQIDTTTKEPFKLNNNYTSRYARLIMKNEPRLAGFFSTRVVY